MTSLNELEKIEASQLVIEQSDVLFEINEICKVSFVEAKLFDLIRTRQQREPTNIIIIISS